MTKISVIVPGAGAARRFGGKRNKIYQRIAGQPLFLRTLELFSGRENVIQTQLVISSREMPELKERFGANLGLMGVQIVRGGSTRTQSVRNALANVSPEADLICVHDAVRPCVATIWIDAVFEQAERSGAAILAYPVHGTLKKVSAERHVEETIPRVDVWQAQTPQVFRREILLAAYESAGEDATDDAQLVEAAGHRVDAVMGDPRNIKITTPTDLALAAAVIGSLPKPKPDHTANPFEDAQW